MEFLSYVRKRQELYVPANMLSVALLWACALLPTLERRPVAHDFFQVQGFWLGMGVARKPCRPDKK